MAFESVIDLLFWYADSKKLLINLQKESPYYDSKCPLTKTLEVLTEFYDPRPVLGDDARLAEIYRVLWGLGELDDCGLGRVCYEDIPLDVREDLQRMEQEYVADGKIMKAIRTREMAEELGIETFSLQRILWKRVPPIEMAWKVGEKKYSRWRFDPAQIDNFKRWLSNSGVDLKERTPKSMGCVLPDEPGHVDP